MPVTSASLEFRHCQGGHADQDTRNQRRGSRDADRKRRGSREETRIQRRGSREETRIQRRGSGEETRIRGRDADPGETGLQVCPAGQRVTCGRSPHEWRSDQGERLMDELLRDERTGG
ncbi:unnamed protein product [Arctogadus glacialis]